MYCCVCVPAVCLFALHQDYCSSYDTACQGFLDAVECPAGGITIHITTSHQSPTTSRIISSSLALPLSFCHPFALEIHQSVNHEEGWKRSGLPYPRLSLLVVGDISDVTKTPCTTTGDVTTFDGTCKCSAIDVSA